jgi:uncharacterized protein YjbI with pentapeptide repeats
LSKNDLYPSGIFGGLSRSLGLQMGQGAPPPPHRQASSLVLTPPHGLVSWSSQTQPVPSHTLNQGHLDILAKGVKAWNAWRTGQLELRPDLRSAELSSADLRSADLRGADLNGADVRGANLRGADLRGADLSGADLKIANLTDANLTDATLNSANLMGADLKSANLAFANLSLTRLEGADLSGAILESTVLGNIDLSTVRGLNTVQHEGPSSIGVDTIYLSQGKIPDSFLRGCGVPDNFIAYMKSLTGAALDFYSCFISYSGQDQVFADRLHADLQARGVRCWFAPHDIQGGRKIHEQIDAAIRIYDKLLLILSDASMSSNWVKTEIANARTKEEQQKRQMLFPITLVPYDRIKGWTLFDADTGIDSAREIREYFAPDFSNWKDHDSYTKAFDRLVRDLKAEPKSKGTATTE